MLALATDAAGADPPTAGAAWSATEASWRERVPELANTLAPRDARHAYAVITGLTSGAGGMVAAATMSLPERARQGRNFDYRYAWIRDQCYAGRAAAAAGPHAVLDNAVGCVGAVLREQGLTSGRSTPSPAMRFPTSASSTCPATRARTAC